jgi:Tol biopolymer transport system component
VFNYHLFHIRDVLLFSFICLIFLMAVVGETHHVQAVRDGNPDEPSDLLALSITPASGNKSFILYNPKTGDRRTLLIDANPYIIDFNFSPKGLFAYSSATHSVDDTEIYVLDTNQQDASPVNISQGMPGFKTLSGWSRDGKYLAFISNFSTLYLWDGKQVIDITPTNQDAASGDHLRISYLSWSYDGRLLLAIGGQNLKDQVYLWDGSTTMNLSQNPSEDANNSSWSADGRVAFLSEDSVTHKAHILIWDGVSMKNGLPNLDSFTDVTLNVTGYWSEPGWTNDGHLAYVGIDPDHRVSEVYRWYGETVTNLSQTSGTDFSPMWSADGRWAFMSYEGDPFSHGNKRLHVRDADNKPLLIVQADYPPAWSSTGYLTFCKEVLPFKGFTLSIWDGKQVTELAQGYNITAQWQSGPANYCTYG